MTELELRKTAVDPFTGEVLELDRPLVEQVEWLRRCQEIDRRWCDFKRDLKAVVIAKLDRDASWTAHFDGVKVTANSPKLVREWDVEALRETLDELVGEGVISVGARDEVIKEKVEYKVASKGVNAIEKVPGVAERLKECYVEVPPRRWVKVV